MPLHTSGSPEKGGSEESSWSREFLIAQVATLFIVAVALVFALISEDRGLIPDPDRGAAYGGPAVGISSDLGMSGAPVECTDTGGLAEDCVILLSVLETLAGEADLDWSKDAPVSDWKGVLVRGDPPRVVALNLTTSGLTGRIPSALGGLTELRALHLYGNELTGVIPAELGKLAKLDTLDLGDNRITGAIPPELGRIEGLQSLDLSFNQLTGEVPSQIGDIERLEWLVIAENELTGSIAEILESLPDLGYLSIYGNQISGCIPSKLREVDGFLGDLPFCDAR